MKKYIKYLMLAVTIGSLSACSYLNLEKEGYMDEDMFLHSGPDKIIGYGLNAYNYLQGLNSVSGTLMAAACDEADYSQIAEIQKFNTGGWGPFSNPDDVWSYYYKGIRQVNLFLEQTVNYPELLVQDTIKNKPVWLRNCDIVKKLRAENRVLRAYFYMELIKRYGGVPIVDAVITEEDVAKYPRNTFDECVDYIVKECNAAYPDLATHFTNYGYDSNNEGNGGLGNDNTYLGRIDKPVAKGLIIRALLYAASKLNNSGNDVSKWIRVCQAGADFMSDPNCAHIRTIYTDPYGSLFNAEYNNNTLVPRADLKTGIMLTRPYGTGTNAFEKANYPVGMTNATGQAVCPSYNLVKAYANHRLIHDATKPLDNMDARFGYSVVTPGSVMGMVNGVARTTDSYVGGVDGIGVRTGATTTGFYLKKFLCTSFDLVKGDSKNKSWVLMRYEEMLLDIAEAMNEAYGPDAKGALDGVTYNYSARELVNMIDNRPKWKSDPAPLTLNTKETYRDWLYEERQLELAFEGHRFFDVRRWMIAEKTENEPLLGLRVYKDAATGTLTYEEFEVEQRSFVAPKMYLYPIPQSEINKSKGVLVQNPGW
jgi:hypothetical protein